MSYEMCDSMRMHADNKIFMTLCGMGDIYEASQTAALQAATVQLVWSCNSHQETTQGWCVNGFLQYTQPHRDVSVVRDSEGAQTWQSCWISSEKDCKNDSLPYTEV